MKNWIPKVFGGLLSVSMLAQGAGINIGHVGSVSGTTAVASISALLLGWYTKQKNVTGGDTKNDIGQ